MYFNSAWIFGSALTAISIVLSAGLVRYLLSTRRPKDFPPGPLTFLGIGNIHQIPPKHPFLKFHEWSKVYGGILGLKIGSSNLVVINDPRHLHELFSKRGNIYSGRFIPSHAQNYVMMENRYRHILNSQPGAYLRKWRKLTVALFGSGGQTQAAPLQEATSSALVGRLLRDPPSKSIDNLKFWALATPLLAISGQRLEDRPKSFPDRFFKTQNIWVELIDPGTAPLASVVTFLQLVPRMFAEWKRKAATVRDYMQEEYYGYLRAAKEVQSAQGSKSSGDTPCIMAKFLDGKDDKESDPVPLDDDDIAYIGGSLLDAAVDTTFANISSLVLYMATNPDVQKRAYDEISQASPDQPPDMKTAKTLPYTRACVLEILRLRPPAPSGVPHILESDDIYCGYTIPKGTTVLPNIWTMQHNPEDYDQPDEFIPERFLQHPMGLKREAQIEERRQATYSFAAGRRICPGEVFAQTSVQLAAAKLLWAYDIKPLGPLDTGIEKAYHSGLVVGPNPFKVQFKLRDEAKRAGILQDQKKSQAVLEDLGM